MTKLGQSCQCLGWRNQGIGHQTAGAILGDGRKWSGLAHKVKDENEDEKHFHSKAEAVQ